MRGLPWPVKHGDWFRLWVALIAAAVCLALLVGLAVAEHGLR